MASHAVLLMPIKGNTGSEMRLCGFKVSVKSHNYVKADLAIYSQIHECNI